ncbi:hypothetical protein Dda_5824 [Drechslerella dactyloides]|uniref:F-box domain-containing protein n=1 Tax=Drechslerella dactyloides TaxID=74499 RepID=A0AAD6IUJ2_DREDA|nr:hypothetical protein Dda_5824 [Drechslerella dactyloides]
MDDSSRDFIRFRSTTFLADIINRSPRLEHIMLDLQGCRGVSGWRAQISKELKAAKNLRSFEYYSRLTPTPKLIPEILLRLKRLVVSKNSITLPLTDDLLLNLRLESFGTSAYSNNVARLLKGCRTTLKELEIWGVEDGPMVEGLGEDFWYNVVARHSPTLKRLAVHVDSADPDPAWYWFDEVWNPANWVLSRCSQLEELKIGWHPGENLVDLVDSLIVTCPKLHLITFDYIGTSIVYAGVEMYGDLCLFKTANPAFGNRQLDLVFENRVGPGSISSMDWNQRYCRNFVLPDFFDDFDPPKWHDTLLKIWRLSENGVDKYTKQKQYAFDRLDTVYALDDGSDSSWRHYECNMGYLDDAIADYNRNKYAWRHRTNVNTVVRTRTLYYRDDDDEDDEDDENE